eukprot:2728908-Rhodomonas_salina.1
MSGDSTAADKWDALTLGVLLAEMHCLDYQFEAGESGHSTFWDEEEDEEPKPLTRHEVFERNYHD